MGLVSSSELSPVLSVSATRYADRGLAASLDAVAASHAVPASSTLWSVGFSTFSSSWNRAGLSDNKLPETYASRPLTFPTYLPHPLLPLSYSKFA